MRIVVDTNTLISATLFPHSIPGKCIHLYRNHLTILASAETIAEFAKVIRYSKFDKYLTDDERDNAIKQLTRSVIIVETKTNIQDCRDPDDNKFLELAIDGKADIVISGDKDLLHLHPFQNIPIISPTAFFNIISSKH